MKTAYKQCWSLFKQATLKAVTNSHFNKPIDFTWITDTHLSPQDDSISELISKLNASEGHFVLHTGDITNYCGQTQKFLLQANDELKKPLYFVLGNHDYDGSYDSGLYRSDRIKGVRKLITKNLTPTTVWLGTDMYVPLNDETALIGIDGFSGMQWSQNKVEAENLENKLKGIYERGFRKIIIATHIPPFPEACLELPKRMNGLPYSEYIAEYCSEVTGKVIENFSTKFPNTSIKIYCGHTHVPAYFKHSQLNIEVVVGEAYRMSKSIHDIISQPYSNEHLECRQQC